MKNIKPKDRSDEHIHSGEPWVAIFGNPNCGKTALFNRLTGLHHKVGNYPGITVEQKSGWLRGHRIRVRDFPGTYSLNAKSPDEKIVSDAVQSWRNRNNRPMAVIVVLDATNLSRNLYLALQILDWSLPTIIVLNMMDEARKKGIRIYSDLLRIRLNAFAVIPASAKYGEGISDIVNAVLTIRNDPKPNVSTVRVLEIERFLEPLEPIISLLKQFNDSLNHDPLIDSLRLIGEQKHIDYFKPYLDQGIIAELQKHIETVRRHYLERDIPFQALEAASRYAFIDIYLSKTIVQDNADHASPSEHIDAFLTHRYFGPVILIGVLAFIFNAIFSWSKYPMEFINTFFDWLSIQMNTLLPIGLLRSLVVDGIIPGVGNILVFLPQILLLVFFLTLLEDSGYMARMAFMMDRLMHKIGLHGRSVLPLLSGFACAIPAIMAARTIASRRDRLITIMIIPLMSCSARLPVYVLLISAFVPAKTILGIVSVQGLALMGMYLLGVVLAMIIAIVMKRIYPFRENSELIMELPPYRKPLLVSVWWQVYDRGKSFLSTAGSIILAVSIILWFLASYPRHEQMTFSSSAERLESSYAGKIGHFMEPVIKPLGYDWKIGVGLLSSFAAREVIVSTLSTLYNLEEDSGAGVRLINAMQNDHYPDGRAVFTPLVVLSLLIFFAFAGQCMATFAIIKKETNTWRWPIIMVLYLTVLAYISAFLVFQVGTILGFA